MHNPPSIADRVKRLRKGAGLTQAQFADRLLLSRDYISQIENGREPGPRLVQQIEMLEKVGLPSDDSVGTPYLMNADKADTADMLMEEPQASYGTIRPIEVPVVSWARAGAAATYEEIPKDWQKRIHTTCRTPGAFGIEVEGDSMLPEFRHGDVVVVMPEVEPRNHGPVVAKLRDDGVVLKIYTRSREGDAITLTSTNPAYAPIIYRPEDFHWIYPVHSTTRVHWK